MIKTTPLRLHQPLSQLGNWISDLTNKLQEVWFSFCRRYILLTCYSVYSLSREARFHLTHRSHDAGYLGTFHRSLDFNLSFPDRFLPRQPLPLLTPVPICSTMSQLILYDLPSREPRVSWSYNPWKSGCSLS